MYGITIDLERSSCICIYIYMGMRGSGETINPKSSAAIARLFFFFRHLFSPSRSIPISLLSLCSMFPSQIFPLVFFSTFSFIQFSQLLAFVIAQVPFALLGDRARGIFETVYLDDDLRTWVSTNVLTGSMLWIVDGWHFDALFDFFAVYYVHSKAVTVVLVGYS